MIDIEVENFQSIEHCKMTVEGFTALVGRSNLGKSALVRAVKAALTGAPGVGFVRHSDSCARRSKKGKTCDCKSTVSLKAAHFDLKWEKGDRINRYTFNGKVYDRAETGTPDFLLRPHLQKDFGRIEVGRKDRLLQVADQFDNVFLLDQSGNSVADVLSDVANLDQINVAIRAVEKDRKESAASKRHLENEAEEQKSALTQYAGLDQLSAQVGSVAGLHSAIVLQKAKFTRLAKYVLASTEIEIRVDSLVRATAVDLPDATEVQCQRNKADTLSYFVSKASVKAREVSALAGVETLTMPNSEPVRAQSDSFVRVDRWVLALQALRKDFDSLKGVGTVELTADRPTLEQVGALNEREQFIRRVQALQTQIHDLSNALKSAVAEELLVQAEVAALGACPTCAQPICRTSP